MWFVYFPTGVLKNPPINPTLTSWTSLCYERGIPEKYPFWEQQHLQPHIWTHETSFKFMCSHMQESSMQCKLKNVATTLIPRIMYFNCVTCSSCFLTKQSTLQRCRSETPWWTCYCAFFVANSAYVYIRDLHKLASLRILQPCTAGTYGGILPKWVPGGYR